MYDGLGVQNLHQAVGKVSIALYVLCLSSSLLIYLRKEQLWNILALWSN
jgi:uncharacterized membrane protein